MPGHWKSLNCCCCCWSNLTSGSQKWYRESLNSIQSRFILSTVYHLYQSKLSMSHKAWWLNWSWEKGESKRTNAQTTHIKNRKTVISVVFKMVYCVQSGSKCPCYCSGLSTLGLIHSMVLRIWPWGFTSLFIFIIICLFVCHILDFRTLFDHE